ncbi:MAG: S53 family peptidase [Rhodanobacter sp.]
MKILPKFYRRPLLVACIAMALPAVTSAQSSTPSLLSGLNTAEAPRVTQTINDRLVSTLPNTHVVAISSLQPKAPLADTTRMSHLQLILKRGSTRVEALNQLIAGQHNPSSPFLHHWLTPAQYGQTFGVADSDVAAAKSWLVSQGFTVNGVYPNRMQIDFSGTVGQVNRAFHTQENVYSVAGKPRVANATDISVPSALQPIVVGVAGLSTLRPQPLHIAPRKGQWDKATGMFRVAPSTTHALSNTPSPQAITLPGGEVRGLVPGDLSTIYNVNGVRAQGVTGKGVTIAVVEDDSMVPGDWTNFVTQFNLRQYGGTFSQIQPQSGGMNNCYDPDVIFGSQDDGTETVLDAEWSTAIAPGANIVVASCSDYDPSFNPATDNFFGGVFIAATNLINGNRRPDIISASYGYGEGYTDAASKTAIDQMWAQADVEGISVFVSTGDSGSNPSFNGGIINGVGIDANSFATSPHVTGVGGNDTADVLDGTTNKYFSKSPRAYYVTAKSYVPEIPWNQSCGNEVAAKAMGFNSGLAFCKAQLKFDPLGYYITSEAGSGGPSSVDFKPIWQRLVTGAAKDNSRDLPDVSLFAGSYGGHTYVVICDRLVPCDSTFSQGVELTGGTSLSSPMFAGMQALVDQKLAKAGLPMDQGNAAPVLYALAGIEYGTGYGSTPASLAACSADNGTVGTNSCVFHNVTRGSIATNCFQRVPTDITPDCYFYGTVYPGTIQVGLTTTNSARYNEKTEAFLAQPGWSFASGLGSVNAANLVSNWSKLFGVK